MLNNVFDLPIDYEPLPDGTGRPIYSSASRVAVQFQRCYQFNERAFQLNPDKEAWEEFEVILLQAPKDTNIVAHRANDFHRREYAAQYERFQKGQRGELGTPIDQLYNLTPKQVAQLHVCGIFTIEQAAAMGNEMLAREETFSDIQRKAQLWLSSKSNLLDVDQAIKDADALKQKFDIIVVESRQKDEELDALRAEILALREGGSVKPKVSKPRGKSRAGEVACAA